MLTSDDSLRRIARELAVVLQDLMSDEGGEPKKDDPGSVKIWKRADRIIADAVKIGLTSKRDGWASGR